MRGQMPYLGREGGQMIFQALVIPYKGYQMLPKRQRAAWGRRDRNGAQRHERVQPQGFQTHCLTAGVAAADDQGALVTLQADIHML